MTKLTIRLIALPLMLAPLAALAGDAGSDPVERLKSALPSTTGFQVDAMKTTDDGYTCIKYKVVGDTGAVSTNHAVVKGDEVQRSTPGNKRFEKAWNSKCVTSGGQ